MEEVQHAVRLFSAAVSIFARGVHSPSALLCIGASNRRPAVQSSSSICLAPLLSPPGPASCARSASRAPSHKHRPTHAMRFNSSPSSAYVLSTPYPSCTSRLLRPTSALSSSSRRSRCATRSKRGSSARESRSAESDSVGEGGLGRVSSGLMRVGLWRFRSAQDAPGSSDSLHAATVYGRQQVCQ